MALETISLSQLSSGKFEDKSLLAQTAKTQHLHC